MFPLVGQGRSPNSKWGSLPGVAGQLTLCDTNERVKAWWGAVKIGNSLLGVMLYTVMVYFDWLVIYCFCPIVEYFTHIGMSPLSVNFASV